MSPARDTQCSKLYKWERTCFDDWPAGARADPAMALAECETLIDKAWRLHSPRLRAGSTARAFSVPKVTDGRRARNATGSYRRITLPRWSRCLPVVLHELAHALMTSGIYRLAAHGPEFARVYIELLVRYCGRDRADLLASAKAARVKVAPWAPVKKMLMLRGLGG